MPHFTLTFTQGAPMINAVVMVSAARRAAIEALKQPVPQPQAIRALVDTGASHTCIDPTVLQALQLQPTGSIPIHTPSTGGTPMSADTYDIGLMIPGPPATLPFVRANMQVSAMDLISGQGLQMLLGRDVLSQFVMTYNGAGGAGFFLLAY